MKKNTPETSKTMQDTELEPSRGQLIGLAVMVIAVLVVGVIVVVYAITTQLDHTASVDKVHIVQTVVGSTS